MHNKRATEQGRTTITTEEKMMQLLFRSLAETICSQTDSSEFNMHTLAKWATDREHNQHIEKKILSFPLQSAYKPSVYSII